jgi:hypothetical protein
MKRLTPLIIIFLCLTAIAAAADRLPDGYGEIPWGTDLRQVMKNYPRGNLERLHNDYVYRQFRPNREIFVRTFIFEDDHLVGVSIKFNPDYVKKSGTDKLLARYRKIFGEGAYEQSPSPHVISYIWEGPKTRISFGYMPKRPDMTIMVFQQK